MGDQKGRRFWRHDAGRCGMLSPLPYGRARSAGPALGVTASALPGRELLQGRLRRGLVRVGFGQSRAADRAHTAPPANEINAAEQTGLEAKRIEPPHAL